MSIAGSVTRPGKRLSRADHILSGQLTVCGQPSSIEFRRPGNRGSGQWRAWKTSSRSIFSLFSHNSQLGKLDQMSFQTQFLLHRSARSIAYPPANHLLVCPSLQSLCTSPSMMLPITKQTRVFDPSGRETSVICTSVWWLLFVSCVPLAICCLWQKANIINIG